MLVLSRKPGEGIQIGDDIRVVLVRASDGRARLGIEAPRDVSVVRDELVQPVDGVLVTGSVNSGGN
jgi:carbon storage regulator